MPFNYKKDISINPRGITYALLFVGLTVFAYALLAGKMAMAVGIVSLPIFLLVCISGMQYPMLSYLVYCVITFYFSAIYRYARIEGLSGILDVFLFICLFSISINIASGRGKDYAYRHAFNVLSVGQLLWIFFCILELLAPYSHLSDFINIRGFFTIIPISYLLSGILLNSHKKLVITLLLLGIFIVTAAMKLYWQKAQGWDAFEVKFLITDGGWHTHLLRDGTRYFSFFSDAGNFGAVMGVLFTTFALISTVLKKSWFRIYCIGISLLAAIGLIMAGTRGAIAIPFAGLFLYLILSKNMKAAVISAVIGLAAFSFFYFTDIGDGNAFIRRTRTAFRPTEDASYNVRVGNRKRFAYYLADKPFGVGIGGHVVDVKNLLVLNEDYIPTDSYYVDVWVENGIVGLCVYLLFLGIVFLRCCYVLLFKIHHPQLRKILIAMLSGIFGLWVSGYVGRAMGMTPSTLLIPIFLSFVLNGPHIDKNMSPGFKF